MCFDYSQRDVFEHSLHFARERQVQEQEDIIIHWYTRAQAQCSAVERSNDTAFTPTLLALEVAKAAEHDEHVLEARMIREREQLPWATE
jgi:hypothetical protein